MSYCGDVTVVTVTAFLCDARVTTQDLTLIVSNRFILHMNDMIHAQPWLELYSGN